MYHPHAAARIARDLPGVKLIVLVRDPVERAYSQHAHELARGFEPETRLRPRAGAGAGPAARPGGAAGRRPARTTASPTSTTPTGPAASTPATSSALAAARRPRPDHVVESERFFADARGGRTTRCSTSSACRAPGLPGVRAAQRPARAVRRWTSGSARELTAHFAAHDERAGRLARPHAGLAPHDGHHAAPRGRRSRRVAGGARGASPGGGRGRTSLGAGARRAGRASPSPGWSRTGSVPSGPARSSPPPPRSCSPAALAKLGTQTGLVYWPARLRAPARPICSAPACAPRSRPVVVAALAVGVGVLARRAGARPAHRATVRAPPPWPATLRVLAVFLPLHGAHRRAARRHPRLPADAPDRAARPDRCRPRAAGRRRRPRWRCRGGAARRRVRARLGAAVPAGRGPGRLRAAPRALVDRRGPRRAGGPSARTGRALRRGVLARSPGRARWPASRSSPCSGSTCCWSPRSPASAPPPSTRSPAGSWCWASSPTRASRRPCSRAWPRRSPSATGPTANRLYQHRDRLAGAAHLAALPAGDRVRPAVPRAVRRPSYRDGAAVVVVLAGRDAGRHRLRHGRHGAGDGRAHLVEPRQRRWSRSALTVGAGPRC